MDGVKLPDVDQGEIDNFNRVSIENNVTENTTLQGLTAVTAYCYDWKYYHRYTHDKQQYNNSALKSS